MNDICMFYDDVCMYVYAIKNTEGYIIWMKIIIIIKCI